MKPRGVPWGFNLKIKAQVAWFLLKWTVLILIGSPKVKAEAPTSPTPPEFPPQR